MSKQMKKVRITVLKTHFDAEDSLSYYGDWIEKPGVAIACCNDGIRPVVFKIEATDGQSIPPTGDRYGQH